MVGCIRPRSKAQVRAEAYAAEQERIRTANPPQPIEEIKEPQPVRQSRVVTVDNILSAEGNKLAAMCMRKHGVSKKAAIGLFALVEAGRKTHPDFVFHGFKEAARRGRIDLSWAETACGNAAAHAIENSNRSLFSSP